MINISTKVMAGLILSLISFSIFAETHNLKPSIGGYSPVSYFTKNKAERGLKEFSVKHKGKLYYLASAEQIAIFKKNPDKYRPRYNVCPYSLSLGRKASLDPENYKVIANSLLLFHKSDSIDGRDLWNKSSLSEQDLLDRADKQYLLLEF